MTIEYRPLVLICSIICRHCSFIWGHFTQHASKALRQIAFNKDPFRPNDCSLRERMNEDTITIRPRNGPRKMN